MQGQQYLKVIMLQKVADFFKSKQIPAVEGDQKVEEQETTQDEDPVVHFEGSQNTLTLEAFLEGFSFSLIPRNRIVKLDSTNTTTIPVALKFSTLRNKPSHKHQQEQTEESKDAAKYSGSGRPGIDLVCVVDVSGSMQGEKLKLVKDSLRYIMKILGEQDRLCIVDFDTHATLVTRWLRNTAENKKILKSSIMGMRCRSSTNIQAGLEMGLKMIEQRRQKNPVTCLFLLSDGQDDNGSTALQRVEGTIQSFSGIKESFLINTFGYGKDHDPVLMNGIAQQKNGNFHFIENVSKASEYFVLSMSGMLSVAAEKIVIKLNQPRMDEGIVVSKLYGEGVLWTKNHDNEIVINLNYILLGDTKEFIFEITLPKSTGVQLQDEQKAQTVAVSYLDGIFVSTGQPLKKRADLELIFLNADEALEDIIIDSEVEISYLRTKAGEVIGIACSLAKQKQYDEAQKVLDDIVKELQTSPFQDSIALKTVLEDIERSKKMCQPKVFAQEGQAYLLKKQRNHMQRQASYENLLDWNEDQHSVMSDMKRGDLALSCLSNGDDYQNNAFDDDQLSNGPVQGQGHKRIRIRKTSAQFNQSIGSDLGSIEDIEDLQLPRPDSPMPQYRVHSGIHSPVLMITPPNEPE